MSHSKSFAYFFFSLSNLQAIKKPLQCAYTCRPSRQSMTPCVIWSTALRRWARLVTQSPAHPGTCGLLPPAENHACVLRLRGESPMEIRILPSLFKLCASQILTKIQNTVRLSRNPLYPAFCVIHEWTWTGCCWQHHELSSFVVSCLSLQGYFFAWSHIREHRLWGQVSTGTQKVLSPYLWTNWVISYLLPRNHTCVFSPFPLTCQRAQIVGCTVKSPQRVGNVGLFLVSLAWKVDLKN